MDRRSNSIFTDSTISTLESIYTCVRLVKHHASVVRTLVCTCDPDLVHRSLTNQDEFIRGDFFQKTCV